jgi:uncharacterized protein (DUF342 family)
MRQAGNGVGESGEGVKAKGGKQVSWILGNNCQAKLQLDTALTSR